jgi:ribosomal protein L37AE/L43A
MGECSHIVIKDIGDNFWVCDNCGKRVNPQEETKSCEHNNSESLGQAILTKWHCNNCGEDYTILTGNKDLLKSEREKTIRLVKEWVEDKISYAVTPEDYLKREPVLKSLIDYLNSI